MAELRDALLRIESGIWFLTKRFGLGFVLISSFSMESITKRYIRKWLLTVTGV